MPGRFQALLRVVSQLGERVARVARGARSPVQHAEQGLAHLASGAWAKAEQELAAALLAQPDRVDWRERRAFALLKQKKHAAAAEAYDEVLRAEPPPPVRTNAWIGAGQCCLKRGDWTGADRYFSLVSGARRNRMPLVAQHASAMIKLGRAPEALAILVQAVTRKPASWKLVDALLRALEPAVAPPEHLRRLRAALKKRPKEPQLHAAIAALAEQAQDLPGAAAAYRSALAAAEGRAQLHVSLAHVLVRMGLHAEALPHMARAAELLPGDPLLPVHVADLRSHTDPSARPSLAQTHSLRYSGCHGDVLYIVFSPYQTRFVFGHGPWDGDTLLVHENRITYYTYNQDALAEAVRKVVVDNGYRKVCFIGSSKGCYGALSISGRVAPAVPDADCFVVAFSPQTELWPRNQNIARIPSYGKYMKNVRRSRTSLDDLQKHGSLRWLEQLAPTNLQGVVVFGGAFEQDATEARRLASVPYLELRPVEGWTMHATSVLYMKSGESRLRALTGRLADKTADDDYFTPENAKELAVELLGKLDPEAYRLETLLAPWRSRTIDREAPSPAPHLTEKTAWMSPSAP